MDSQTAINNITNLANKLGVEYNKPGDLITAANNGITMKKKAIMKKEVITKKVTATTPKKKQVKMTLKKKAIA